MLKLASDDYECFIHAYVLMTNHVHLLVTPKFENSVSLMMQAVIENMFDTLMDYINEVGRYGLSRTSLCCKTFVRPVHRKVDISQL